MNLSKSNFQKKLINSVKIFSEKNIRPYVMKWDEMQIFPLDLFKSMGKLGYMGAIVPKKFGGINLSYFEYISLIEEISKVDPSIGLSLAAHNSLCINHILLYGNIKQKNKWLPKLASGNYIGSWALTEKNAGSDIKNMDTFAYKDGDEWVINGMKTFITHAISSDIKVIITRTGEKGDKNGMTTFVVKKNTPGVFYGRKLNKLGMRASETAEIIFKNCRLSDNKRLGNIGEGFNQVIKILQEGRISIAAISLGISKASFEASLEYSKTRNQFKKSISKFQAISFKLAKMATEIEASELLIYKACYRKHKNKSINKESSMCKYYASEACVRITNHALQIFGGYGYIKDFPIEKFYRDAKLCTIGEGTSEIQKIIISKSILKN